LQVSDFIIKPLNIDTITSVINKVSEKLFLKNSIIKKNTELELYLKTIEQIAFIVKMDLDFNITYINDLLCNSVNCELDNTIGQSFDFIKSKITTYNAFDNLQTNLQNGEIWENTIKIEKNDKEFVYLKAKIIQIYYGSSKNVQEYVFIAYPVTDEENEKKELNKKMFQSIAQLKKESYSSSIENKKLEDETQSLKNQILKLEMQLTTANNTKASLLNQLEAYEISSLNQSNGKVDLLRKKNEEMELVRKSFLKMKSERDLLIGKINELKETIKHKDNLIDIFQKNELKLNDRIKNLEDIVSYLEKPKEVKKNLFNL
jgi:hypothetical protein